MPIITDLSFTGLDEFVNEPVVENCKAMSSKEEPKDQGVIDSGSTRHMTGNMSYLTNYEEIDGGYVAFGGNPKGGKITRKEAVNTACYFYETQFGGPVTILNTIDHLGKFYGKADEGFFVGYYLNSKAFRVFNSRTRIVEENLHIRFSENTPNVVGSGPDWLFDIDALTRIMNYEPIVASTQSNGFAGTKASDNAGQARKETKPVKDYILLPLWTADPPYSQDPKSSHDDGSKPSSDDGKKVDEDPRKESECNDQEKEDNVNTNNVNAAGTNEVNTVGGKTSIELPFDPNMPDLEDYSIFDFSRNDEDDGVEADMNNLDTTIQVSSIPTIRIHKDHPLDQVIGDLQSATQTRNMSKNLEEHGFVSTIQQRTNHKDIQNCLFACFLSQEEPKKVILALKDPSWIEAMQEELLQFKLQEVWTLVDLPNGKRAIGTKKTPTNKLHDTIYENAKVRAQLFDKVSEQKDTSRETSANTKFAKQSILGKPPSSSRPKLYAVTPLPKSTAILKVGEMNALSSQVTSNSVPSSQELKVVENDNVIAPRMFRIDPRKTSRKDNFVPNKHVKASVRTKPITVSQPHVITKNDVNSKTNGFSPKDVKSTTRTRRP
ncbi:putative ribonuclease H-like domain-containing protein [Tanacetum coccineum]